MVTSSRSPCLPRFGTPRSPERLTLGPAIGEVARKLGRPFMPHQQHMADVIGEINAATGRLAYSQYGILLPRQEGKSVFVLAKATHRASATRFFGRHQRIVYTAQTRKAAREKWEEDFAPDLQGSAAFKNRFKTHKGNGNEHFRFQNGSRFGIEANTDKAGHGPPLDEAFIDEAFAQVDSRLEQAFRPAMITRPNKQLGWISTAGWSDASFYLREKVKLGRAAVEADRRTGLAYFEYSAPEGSDPGDPAVWWACMPALGITITEEAIAEEFDTMDLADFQRAYLNMWVPKPVALPDSAVPPELWEDCRDGDSQIAGDLSFVLDVNPAQSWSSIAVGGLRGDGLPHVELTSSTVAGQVVVDHRPGTEWVVPRCVDLKAHWSRFKLFIVSGSPAESLVPALTKAGVEVEYVKAVDVPAACGLFYNLATTAGMRHLGQQDLTTALGGARKNVEDGEGGWRWGRKKSSSEISPVYATTVALWVVMKAAIAEYDVMESFF